MQLIKDKKFTTLREILMLISIEIYLPIQAATIIINTCLKPVMVSHA